MIKSTKKDMKPTNDSMYPCLMASGDDKKLIVLMTGAGSYPNAHSGVVVYSERDKHYAVGTASNTLSPAFILYTDEVTIESIK